MSLILPTRFAAQDSFFTPHKRFEKNNGICCLSAEQKGPSHTWSARQDGAQTKQGCEVATQAGYSPIARKSSHIFPNPPEPRRPSLYIKSPNGYSSGLIMKKGL